MQFDTDTWTGEIRLQGRLDVLGRPATLVVGVDRYEQEFFQDLSFGFLDGPGTPNFFADNFADFTPRPELVQFRDEETETQQTGGYAQFQVRPFDRLSVLLGGRYDSAETTFENRVGGTKSERDDDAFTGRIGLVFDVRRNVSLYGLYAESFQPVLFNTRSDGELLEPEEGKIYEGGIKT
ncbi:MAG: TonB-dependent receptor domain-containing protein, partial [Nevskiales bacterium]